jgi:hypothetical protein
VTTGTVMTIVSPSTFPDGDHVPFHQPASLTQSRAARLAVLLLIVSLAAACRSSAVAAGHDAGPALGDAFRSKLRAAVGHAAQDELHRAFVRTRTVRLTGGRLGGLDRLTVAGDGLFVTSDLHTPAVSLFGADGRFMRRLGGKGLSPGRYQLPSGVGAIDGRRLAVLDFDPKRINVFDLSGDLVGSTAYSMHSFSGQALSASPDGTLSVFGVSSPGGRRGADSRLIHQFTAEGVHIRSVLPLPDDLPQWASSYLEPSLSHSPGGLRVALALRYQPYLVAADGRIESARLKAPPTFRGPASAFEPRAAVPAAASAPPNEETKRRFYLAYQDWRLSWTPVESVAAVGDTLIVQYQTFDPLRYTLDLWSIADEPVLLDQVHTNLRLLSVGPDGTCLFRENVDGKAVIEPSIVVATLKPRR